VTGRFSRRDLLAGGGLATAGLVAVGGSAVAGGSAVTGPAPAFAGPHQAGIATREQASLAFATFDVTVTDLPGLSDLLGTWTGAARRLTAGLPLQTPGGLFAPPSDTGEADGLPTSRLTLTVGFGPSLFDGRFGLAARRPVALVDLPPFAGDALDPGLCGGDICIQACADDPQVAFHAVHGLARVALGSAALRYWQSAFGRAAAGSADGSTPRNLLGFHDGTNNLDPDDPVAMDRHVWVEDSDQPWMKGGTFMVARRIRLHLEAWDRSTLDDQQQTIGRQKSNGAPLGGSWESSPVDLAAVGPTGQAVIPDNAHIRVVAPATNGGAAILRRGYNFSDGVDPVSGEMDAGLFFICFQKDPRQQFIPLQTRLSLDDALAEYLVPTGSGIFACPPGVDAAGQWGAGLI
jgi:deferrochelatase/peroxidase EfeB